MANREKDFIEMINTHRGIIIKVCNLYERDHDGRKDLFQDIVLQLWRSFDGFRHEAQFSTWMYRVALNTAISSLRKRTRRSATASLTDAELNIPDLANQRDERLAIMHESIQALSNIEKAIILLYLEEKSYTEIGNIMGITASNVGVRINRIKTKLENIVKSQQI
jgi:RNA polymerase sigma factor (sigma-70 family)